MKTKADYINSLEQISTTIYSLGELVKEPLKNPVIRPAINALAATYELAGKEEFKDPLTAISHLNGEEINRYLHVCHNIDDLVKRVRSARIFQDNICSCTYRCAGCAPINALYATTFDIDAELGTKYHQRFREYLKYLQKEDLAVTCAITDVKGNRAKRPSGQSDPDLFLRVIDERKDGIIVRGAKAHQSGAPIAHELLVVPTITMREEDEDYAVACAIPNGAKGMFHIYQHSLSDSRKLIGEDIDLGNPEYGFGHSTSLVIFDDVFVPWERVFMCKEYQFTRPFVTYMGRHMRTTSGACRAAQCDLLLGAAALIAEYNGIDKVPHVQDKLTEISFLMESSFACALGAAVNGSPTPSGAWFPDALLANAALLSSKRVFHEAANLTVDIAGGLVSTMPSERDFKHPQTGKWIDKYLRGKADVPTENRLRVLRFIENMAASPHFIGVLHGAGAPEVQKTVIRANTDFEGKKRLVKRLARIEDSPTGSSASHR
jgi:4-hydroxybutyryl-CoA dehydratase/vinylacetyl-CoA-Delta-isomerase